MTETHTAVPVSCNVRSLRCYVQMGASADLERLQLHLCGCLPESRNHQPLKLRLCAAASYQQRGAPITANIQLGSHDACSLAP